jgi:ABC-type lipoprotein release transport system permease subunit
LTKGFLRDIIISEKIERGIFMFDILQGALATNALYIDPSAATVLLTSISGIVIAVGATAVVLWRKAKKKAAQVLHIDENANKEVEEDIVVKDDEE